MNDSRTPTSSDRRGTRREARPHRAARVLLGVVVVAVVAGVVWKVGSLRDEPAAASTAAPSSATTTLPSFAAGSTAGALAPDLPSDLAPVPSSATVLSSSAERGKDGTHVQFSLSLRTSSDAKKVVKTYTKAWTKAGFSRVSGKPAGSDDGATYRKVSETAKAGTKVGSTELADFLQVAVVKEHGTSLVTVSGQVVAPKPKKTAAPTTPAETPGTAATTGGSTGTGR
ncbi:hypothetical protein ACFT5B_19295 [Luteimicrobium sp. NPDC057192]|uniref:hypothetical protein n=1 Tax=Luteimicrobium sp. NPDC057192 TaxID=3346042 RepID=UPI0036331BF2